MTAIPDFPHFKKIGLTDKPAYERFYKQFEPYSDFSFNNLWVWFNANGNLAMAKHGKNIVLRLDDPFTGGKAEFTVLGKDHAKLTLQRILRWQKSMGLEQKIVMLPEVFARHIVDRRRDLKIAEDYDNSDYIYDVEKMHNAEGHQYASYRRSLSLFQKQFSGDIVCKDLDLTDHAQRITLVNTLHSWDTTYRQDQQSIIEGAALNTCLQLTHTLGTKGIGLYVEGKLQAFVLYHIAPQGHYGMLNHIKCNSSMRHISDFMISCTINKFHELGLSYLNFEQDLGIEGLRSYKQRLRPTRQLKRFTVVPAVTQRQGTNSRAYRVAAA